MYKVAISLILVFFIISCGNEPKTEPLDLMKHGLPIQIMAPQEAVVKSNDAGFYKDVTVKYGDNYFVQIISTSVTISDIAQLKSDQLRQVKKHPHFKEVIFEEENGFIFEKQIDSLTNFDFRYIKIQGSDEYIFQTGLSGTYSQEDVRAMYESVK